MKSEIETLVSQSSPIFELRKECEQKLLNIQKYTNLAEIVAEKNKILQKQKDDLSLHLQQTSKSFTLAQEMLIEKQKVLQKLGTTEATRREIILLTQQKNFRNRQIVEQMRDKIFIVKAIPSIQPPSGPSNGQSSGDVKQSTMSVTYNYSVNGQGVSRDGMYLFDEEAAAALSSVAQCLKLLEKLYQIPLRFQVFPFGSRSFICGVENFELFQHQMKSFQKSIENSTFAAPEFENSNEKSEKNKQEDGNQANFGSGGENSSSNPQNLSSSPGFSNLNQENSGISGSTLSANSSTASSFTVDQDVLQKSLVPLFFIKGGDKSKYLSAVKYLNKNIFHVRNSNFLFDFLFLF